MLNNSHIELSTCTQILMQTLFSHDWHNITGIWMLQFIADQLNWWIQDKCYILYKKEMYYIYTYVCSSRLRIDCKK